MARTRREGCLRVDVSGSNGRIYLADGMLTLATVASDDELRRQILNLGLTTEEGLRRVERGEANLSQVLAPGIPVSALADFVREVSVESLYRITKPGGGAFSFALDARPQYSTGQQLDIETVLREAERRAAEWADIETVVTDLRAPIRMVPELPDAQEVTVSAVTWRILAILNGGAGVIDVAQRLGLSEFAAAREIAGLLRSGLVEYVSPQRPAGGRPSTTSVDSDEETRTAGWWETTDQPSDAGGERAGASTEEEERPAEQEEAPTEPGFLDSVFDQGSGESEDDEEAGFSVGLLRRRRMVSRD